MISMSSPVEKKENLPALVRRLARFYFRPDLRSVATIFYAIIFGYCAIYYIDGLFLALKFLLYVAGGSSALTGVSLLITGLVFVISLALPFFTCFYAILVLPEIWKKENWTDQMKWIISIIVALGAFLIIMITDTSARIAAHEPAMQSFIEDVGLNGKI
jgi:hypothetical protein